MNSLDGVAIVYCEGAFNTTNGKTAHGLVRFTHRYTVAVVIDSAYAGRDAGEVLDGKPGGIPVSADLADAMKLLSSKGMVPSHFVVGLAPDGGRLPEHGREAVRKALELGLNVDAGLHDFIGDDPVLRKIASEKGVHIRDIRKPPERSQLHFFTGDIEHVDALKIAVLGTDSAIGKRTTAWILVHGLQRAGVRAELIGTGQTAWMQGARYGVIMDTLVNDFVAGEIEHAVCQAWKERKPDVIVIEGQGSLMNPAYPGGFEILAAGRPDIVILQHAPMRVEYDGFPGYRLHPLPDQVRVIEMLSGKPVVAVTLNHEGMSIDRVPDMSNAIERLIGIPAMDVLLEGAERLVERVLQFNVRGGKDK